MADTRTATEILSDPFGNEFSAAKQGGVFEKNTTLAPRKYSNMQNYPYFEKNAGFNIQVAYDNLFKAKFTGHQPTQKDMMYVDQVPASNVYEPNRQFDKLLFPTGDPKVSSKSFYSLFHDSNYRPPRTSW